MVKTVKDTDLFKLAALSQPVSDGKRGYFIENTIDEAKNDYFSVIKSVDLQDSSRIKVWSGPDHRITQLSLTPDMTALGFLDKVNGQMQLFRMPLDGGAAVQLTDEQRGVERYFWSQTPDCVYLQTTHLADKVVKMTEQLSVTVVDRMRYKANGRGILPTNLTYEFVKYNFSQQQRSQILQQQVPFTVYAVSPSERRLVLGQDRLPANKEDFSKAIYLLTIKTGKKVLVNAKLVAGAFVDAQFSPNGEELLLEGQDNHVMNVAQMHLYRYRIADHSFKDVTAPADLEVGDVLAADFQQNVSGRDFVWLDNERYLYRASKNGRVRVNLAYQNHDHKVLGGKRHITDFSLTPTGQIIFTESQPTVPSQLKLAEVKTGTDLLLYDPNQNYLAKHQLSEPQLYKFAGADQIEVQGWYLPPVETSKRHPAVLYVHGGPQVAFGYSFYHELQVLTAKGYGVIAINPRGGNSYGQDFETAVIGQYGQGDFTDLMTGVDEVLKKEPTIDPKQLYVTGGSYGGFMTNWIETHTTRFRAAVTQRSIADWVSFYGTSDIGYYFTPWELKADLSDVQKLWAFSPLAYVKNAQTPLLILHGEDDLRCPITQGEEFFVGLKHQGVETEMVRFPKSNHELSRSGIPSLRIERLRQIINWFAKHSE